ncbi:MAG: 3-isopropylmalate dehydratase small subunit [Anaerolineae bacterium]|nr:3-isopropylmalate dehydratase small subunit [Anaerolineae bacterium]
MEPLKPFSSTVIAMPTENIDTDQIIPARYLKTTNKQGLGEQLFYDWRYDENGAPKPDFPLNRREAKGVNILIAGNNFGCGSSREHAPWALQGFGFKAVISTYFADIFKGNSLKNGLLPIQVDEETHRQIMSLVQEDPDMQIGVDLEKQAIILPDGREVKFPIDGFARQCLLKGVDQLGYLVDLNDPISAYEASHAARVMTTALGSN